MRYVAFIDILGFKNIVERHNSDLVKLGTILKSRFVAAIYTGLTGKPIDIADFERGLQIICLPKGIGFYQFSDSLIIYTDSDQINRMERIIRALNILLARCITEGIPLRGAMAKGIMHIDPPIIIGKALIDAAKLENQQEWSGIIIDDSCFHSHEEKDSLEQFLSNGLLVRTNAPIKKQGILDYRNNNVIGESDNTAEYVAINWPNYAGSYINGEDDFNNKFFLLTGVSKDNSVLRKRENTYRFYATNVGNKQLPPFIHSADLPGSVTVVASGKE